MFHNQLFTVWMSHCVKWVISIFGRFWTFLVSPSISLGNSEKHKKRFSLISLGFYGYFTYSSPVLLGYDCFLFFFAFLAVLGPLLGKKWAKNNLISPKNGSSVQVQKTQKAPNNFWIVYISKCYIQFLTIVIRFA